MSKYNVSAAKAFLVAIVFASVDVLAVGGTGAGDIYAADGGYATTRELGGLSCTVYRPRTLESGHGVILWGNGTGATPTVYAGLLEHWASWGFVVVAANTMNAGTGRDMLDCLDWLKRSDLASSVDFNRVGTSGHSQGGGGSMMAANADRNNGQIAAAAPIQGYTLGLGYDGRAHRNLSGPLLLLSGSLDALVNPTLNHARVYSDTNVPVFWAILSGVTHFEPVGNGGGFRGITTAWFMYQLMGDEQAATGFEGPNCGYCSASQWEVRSKGL